MPIFLYFKMKHKATKPSKILEIQYWKILTQTWFHHFQMFIMNIVMELFKMDHMVSEFFCTSFCFQIWLLVVLSTWNFFPCRSKVRSFHASNIRIGRPIFVLKDHVWWGTWFSFITWCHYTWLNGLCQAVTKVGWLLIFFHSHGVSVFFNKYFFIKKFINSFQLGYQYLLENWMSIKLSIFEILQSLIMHKGRLSNNQLITIGYPIGYYSVVRFYQK
jgi:hypothetical protein